MMNEKELSGYLSLKASNSLLVRHNVDLINENNLLKDKLKELRESLNEKTKIKVETINYLKGETKEFRKDSFVKEILEEVKFLRNLNRKIRNNNKELITKIILNKEKAIQLANTIGNIILIDRATERKINCSNDIAQLVIDKSKDL